MRAPLPLLALALVACATPPPERDPARFAQARSRPPHELALELPGDMARGGALEGGALDPAAARLRLEPGGRYSSRTFAPAAPFDELLLSWNVDAPDGAAFAVEVQVGRGDGRWSPWLHIGDWNLSAPPAGAVTRFEGGRIDVDVFRSERRYERARYRVRALGPGPIGIARLTLCFSDTGRIARPDAPPRRALFVDVPLRRQGAEAPELASRICSPTSLAIAMAHHGVERPTAEVAARVFDAAYDLYGNWPRAVQTAWTYGLPGYLLRVSSWDVVEELLAEGTPLVISVRAGPGELRGAPYAQTDGHLLVLRGLDARGDALVADPAAPSLAEVARTYPREDLERVWMGIGGVTYVIGR